MNNKKSNVYNYVLCALFASLTAVCTFINIPLPFTPIPINLATMSVFLAGCMLGPKYGTLSQIIYILVGCIGLPVFANYQGGLGVLVGPTGGYLAGYVLAAFVTGLIIKKCGYVSAKKKFDFLIVVLACIAGMITYFTLGTIWFMILTKSELWSALALCVFPFLPGDALKIAAATFLTARFRQMHMAGRLSLFP